MTVSFPHINYCRSLGPKLELITVNGVQMVFCGAVNKNIQCSHITRKHFFKSAKLKKALQGRSQVKWGNNKTQTN